MRRPADELDGAIANIALPTIARDLEASDAATVWVVNIYNVGSVICLLPAAALGEIFGLKRVYASASLSSPVSLACALVALASRPDRGAPRCRAWAPPALPRSVRRRPRHLSPPPDRQRAAMIALSVAAGGSLGPTMASLILSVATGPGCSWSTCRSASSRCHVRLAGAPPGGHGLAVRLRRTLPRAAALGLVLVGVDTLGRRSTGSRSARSPLASPAAPFWSGTSGPAQRLLPLDLLQDPAVVAVAGNLDLLLYARRSSPTSRCPSCSRR